MIHLLLFALSLAHANSTYPLVTIPSAEKPAVDVSVISADKAGELFQKFKADKDIPFAYARDGCYARATEMSRIAEKDGVIFGKIFAEGTLHAKADVPMTQKTTTWGWHVAPVAFVEGPDGKRELKVFDPSLFSGPISLTGWQSAMIHAGTPDAEITHLYFRSRFEQWPKSYTQDKVNEIETPKYGPIHLGPDPFPKMKDLYLPASENKPNQLAMPQPHEDWSEEVLNNTKRALSAYKGYSEYLPAIRKADTPPAAAEKVAP